MNSSDEWTQRAACKGRHDIEFIPLHYNENTVRRPLQLCRTCTVQEPCLQYALETDQPGIWGGTTPAERRRMGYTPTSVTPVGHGTDAGYSTHMRRGEVACAPCKRAHADAKKRRLNARSAS